MSDAEKQFRIDCLSQNILAMAKMLLISFGRLEIMHEDNPSVNWVILGYEWTAREGKYRINLYDEHGKFVTHAYDWFEVGQVMVDEQLDQWFEARGDRNG